MKRLVLLVEGEGDVEAAPVLVKRLLNEHDAWDAVFLDPHLESGCVQQSDEE